MTANRPSQTETGPAEKDPAEQEQPGQAETALAGLDWDGLSAEVYQLLEQASEQFILPRWQRLAEQEIHTKSSASDFVTIADLEAEAWLTPGWPVCWLARRLSLKKPARRTRPCGIGPVKGWSGRWIR